MSGEKRLPSFYVCEEMQKLRAGLNKRKIAWLDTSYHGERDVQTFYWICGTRFTICGNEWSVVHGYGSYGGFNKHFCDHKLLECQAWEMTEPDGFLTAERILKKIDAARNSEITAAEM